MSKKFILAILLGTTTFLSGCGNTPEIIETESVTELAASEEQSVIHEESSIDASMEEAAESVEIADESGIEDSDVAQENADVPLYDRTYLDKEDDGYIYRLTDPDTITKYDELYADAFTSVVNSYNERTKVFGFNSGIDILFGDLVQRDSCDNNVIDTGSDFEMDYNFDLNNVGYTYVDLDSDGTFELIFGVLHNTYDEGRPMPNFERAFALNDGNVVKVFEGGGRMYYWLGHDGHIYETGSSGAAYGGTWRVHFDKAIVPTSDIEWGDNCFIDDEFVGIWNTPVHIVGPIDDIFEASEVPDNRISEEEWMAMEAEWNSRCVRIDWLRMADYLAKH